MPRALKAGHIGLELTVGGVHLGQLGRIFFDDDQQVFRDILLGDFQSHVEPIEEGKQEGFFGVDVFFVGIGFYFYDAKSGLLEYFHFLFAGIEDWP